MPGVVYAAGVRHAYNLAEAFRAEGIKAQAVSGETPKRELAEILARYERGDIDVLINAQLLAEGWNSPRATVCVHLAPTASKRIYQQRVGRVTRRHPGKEAGLVVDFVHPATKHDDPVVTLHSLLDRDVYRGGAIVVGPVRRGRGRRMRVERRVLPVCAEEERRFAVFERELWRIAVEHLDYGEQHVWAALAGARVAPSGWRRARAMLHFDRTGELKSRFLITAVQRNKNPQLRLRALTDIAALRDPDAFDTAIDIIGGWPREERKEATKIMLRALVERRIGRRDQANAWIWRLAEYTRDVHEEYAVQRWPETKRLLGLLVNSAGGAHARNARRLIHAARKQDRRLAAALLAAALAHTPEAEEALRGARTRMAASPPRSPASCCATSPNAARATRRRRRKGGKRPATVPPRAGGALRAGARRRERRQAAQPENRPNGGEERRPAPPTAQRLDQARTPTRSVAARGRKTRSSATAKRRAPARARGTAARSGGGSRSRTGLRSADPRRADAPRPRRASCGRRRRARRPAARRRRCPRASPLGRLARAARSPRDLAAVAARRARARPRASRRRPRQTPPRSAPSSRCSVGSISRLEPERRRGRLAAARRVRAQLGRQLIQAHRHVQADAETAQPSCGRPSVEYAGELGEQCLGASRPSTTSLGHLIRACSPATSQTRDGGEQRQQRRRGSRSTSDISSELPAGAVQRRPWRPRPAVCSSAVTSVPWGAPAIASARARSLVESVRRSAPAGSRARSRGAHQRARRRPIAPSSSAAEPRLTASAAMRWASS